MLTWLGVVYQKKFHVIWVCCWSAELSSKCLKWNYNATWINRTGNASGSKRCSGIRSFIVSSSLVLAVVVLILLDVGLVLVEAELY